MSDELINGQHRILAIQQMIEEEEAGFMTLNELLEGLSLEGVIEDD